jgi:hypothetical protein
MKNTKPKTQVTFAHTRRAIQKIKEPSIRDDFAEMLYGLEFCFANRQKRAAFKCANALVAMAIGLNRTISPAVATGILSGLIEDRKQDAALRRLGAIVDHPGFSCVRAQCIEKKGGKCFTLEGATGGCGNKFGFQFPWRVAIA